MKIAGGGHIPEPFKKYVQNNRPANKKADNLSEKPGIGSAGWDEVKLSSASKEIQLLYSAAANLPEVRETLVERLKAQIDNGSYQVDSKAIARKIIDNSR